MLINTLQRKGEYSEKIPLLFAGSELFSCNPKDSQQERPYWF